MKKKVISKESFIYLCFWTVFFLFGKWSQS